jgi:hypothetical protein
MGLKHEQPPTLPRLRYRLEDGICVRVTDLGTGEEFFGAAAASMHDAKRGRDRIALEAMVVILEHMPDYEECRLDVGDTVVFGLPVDRADEIGPALAYDLAGACLNEIAEGRLTAVWA